MRRILAVLLLLIIGFLGALSPTTVSAVDLNDTICSDEAQASRGVEPDICGDIEEAQGVDGVNPLYGPDGIVTRAIYGMSLAIGVVAMLVIIIGGIKMSLSSGDSGKVKGARDQVIYACVGLVVAGLAQAIVWLVLKRIGD